MDRNTINKSALLLHSDLMLYGYREHFDDARIASSDSDFLQTAQHFFVHPKSKVNLAQDYSPVFTDSNFYDEDDSFRHRFHPLHIYGRAADRLMRREAEENARFLGEVGWNSNSIHSSIPCKKYQKKRKELNEAYLSKNSIVPRTAEQDNAELTCMLEGMGQLQVNKKYITRFITLPLFTEYHPKKINKKKQWIKNRKYNPDLTVRDGYQILVDWAKKLKRIPGCFGYFSIEPHDSGVPHLHLTICFDPCHLKLLERKVRGLYADSEETKNHRKRLYKIQEIKSSDFLRNANYTCKSKTSKLEDYEAWAKTHGIKQIHQFGFHGSKTIWRMAKRYDAESIKQLPDSNFKTMFEFVNKNNACEFFILFKKLQLKSFTLCSNYCTKKFEPASKRLSAVGYWSADGLVWAHSHTLPRPSPVLCEDVYQLIEYIENQKTIVKFDLFSRYESVNTSRVLGTALFLKQSNGSWVASTDHPLENLHAVPSMEYIDADYCRLLTERRQREAKEMAEQELLVNEQLKKIKIAKFVREAKRKRTYYPSINALYHAPISVRPSIRDKWDAECESLRLLAQIKKWKRKNPDHSGKLPSYLTDDLKPSLSFKFSLKAHFHRYYFGSGLSYFHEWTEIKEKRERKKKIKAEKLKKPIMAKFTKVLICHSKKPQLERWRVEAAWPLNMNVNEAELVRQKNEISEKFKLKTAVFIKFFNELKKEKGGADFVSQKDLNLKAIELGLTFYSLKQKIDDLEDSSSDPNLQKAA